MGKSLVIVESPAKAKTISKFLGSDKYIVEASIGHIRDLPKKAAEIPDKERVHEWSRLGVNVEEDFEPLYIIPDEKKAQVKKLRDLLKGADALYLATDEDREGEAISWHLKEALNPRVPFKRLVFHEITKSAIHEAIANPRAIDENLVQAQETRRVLDRLYGYKISPVLWKKVAPGLSAGRVQSVTVKIIVDRERQRTAFRNATWWDLNAALSTKSKESFTATLKAVGGKKLATGKDFDPANGKITDKNLLVFGEDAVNKLAASLQGANFSVTDAQTKPVKRSPYAPFTTSSLQQEANRRLGLGSRDTMRIAQSLYENGYITYMRTDSTTLASEAVSGVRSRIAKDFGQKYLSPQARIFTSKVKNAQEAHEAIRPAGTDFRSPRELSGELNPQQLKVYELIWRRTMACQMADALFQQTAVEIVANDALFKATGKVVEFEGFLKVYGVTPSSQSNSANSDDDDKDSDATLPALAVGDKLSCQKLEPLSHTTQPPARFTEATLIKELEGLGIGRPSTYASIIDTILRREYVFKRGSALVPTFVAYAVVHLLERYFSSLVDPEFTAVMEDDLDAISRGEQERSPYLRDFYFGVKSAKWAGLEKLVEQDIDAREVCTIELGQDQKGVEVNIRVGKYGPFLERGEDRARIPDGTAPDELTIEKALELLASGGQGPAKLGVDPETTKAVYLIIGRFGPFVQLGERAEDKKAEKPKQRSLLPGMKPEGVTLETALEILNLPRAVGKHPKTGEIVYADLGRYGSYLKCGSETRSLAATDNVLTVTLDRAVVLLSEERQRGFRRAAPAALKELGAHPDRPGVTLKIMNGRFGPYVTDGKNHASLPKSADVAEFTLTDAVNLYEAKLAKVAEGGGSAPTRGRRGGKWKSAPVADKTTASSSAKSSAKTPAKAAAKPTRKSTAKSAVKSATKSTAKSTSKTVAKKNSRKAA